MLKPSIIHLTDEEGLSLVNVPITYYFSPGCIVLMHGETGTAAQLFYSDGMFHDVTGKTYFGSEMATKPNLLLIYSPTEEAASEAGYFETPVI